MLSDDFIYDVIEYTMSKEEAQMRLKQIFIKMSLVNYLIEGLLPEQEKKKVVAVYGGGFKPPTSGHFEVA